MKYFFHLLIISVLCFNFIPGVLLAATGGSSTGGQVGGSSTGGQVGGSSAGGGLVIENPIKAKSVGALFEAILDIVLVFAIPIIVFFIILAGFRYVTARGNGHVIEEAHMALLYALIGGVLILGARVLIEVISGTVDAIKG
ncbi:MAG: hypothetical protein RLZZ76_188 [Candidatus Parcubacteria bacterium]|jgi:hypothetical protein